MNDRGRWVLRAAQPADAEALASVLLQSRRELLPYAPMAHSEAEVRNWMAHILVPGGGVMLAERDGQVLGLVAVSEADGIGWIEQLYLAPQQLGQGLGHALLQHALGRLHRPVQLYTFQANSRSRRFYEQHGFVAVALTDGSGNEERCPDVLYRLEGLA
jgi:GNAT superfamily N-acetyltransferase